jgi:tRNA modification GTPase
VKHEEDTIAAIATPIGEGGIAVIRVSGRDAFDITDRVFCGTRPLKRARPQTVHYGHIVDFDGTQVDEVVCTVYRSPHSYTTEDSVEISCHGGLFVTRRVLETVLRGGARMAEPGEFTKRAFLGGRLDLSQAEAVADLIHSNSELSHKNSLQQLRGSLSGQVKRIREGLVEALGLLELELDFAEEGIEIANKERISEMIRGVLRELNALVDSFSIGKYYREGVKVVIVGRPNVGKSSLLNALLNENRVIVTDIAGTTRDTIEESISIDGIRFRLVDTAGLREARDTIETAGIERTNDQLRISDVVLLVVDISQALDNTELDFIHDIKESVDGFNDKCILVLNKLDLINDQPGCRAEDQYVPIGLPYTRLSALTHDGLDSLRRMLLDKVLSRKLTAGDLGVAVTNVRHKEAMEKARAHLELAHESLQSGETGEFVSLDMRIAIDFLGEVIGVVTSEEILNNIFGKFCIGK